MDASVSVSPRFSHIGSKLREDTSLVINMSNYGDPYWMASERGWAEHAHSYWM
jgi:hypothetical protein